MKIIANIFATISGVYLLLGCGVPAKLVTKNMKEIPICSPCRSDLTGGFLVVPLVVFPSEIGVTEYPVILLSPKGEVLKKWFIKGFPHNGILTEEGVLIVAKNASFKLLAFRKWGVWEKLDVISNKESRKTIDMSKLFVHHSFVKFRDHYYFLGYEEIPKKTLKRHEIPKDLVSYRIFADVVLKLDKNFKIVKKYKFIEFDKKEAIKRLTNENVISALKKEYFIEIKNEKYFKISHFNSIHLTMSNSKVKDGPSLLISDRSGNEIILFDLVTEKLVWRSKQGLMKAQHDARFTSKNTISFFDNNPPNSRVRELNINSNKVQWTYDGSHSKLPTLAKFSFSSNFISGVQKIYNGDYVVTEGIRGVFFVVSKNNIVKARYFNPVRYRMPQVYWPLYPIFRVIHYPDITNLSLIK